jgi:hypothetical protein
MLAVGVGASQADAVAFTHWQILLAAILTFLREFNGSGRCLLSRAPNTSTGRRSSKRPTVAGLPLAYHTVLVVLASLLYRTSPFPVVPVAVAHSRLRPGPGPGPPPPGVPLPVVASYQ